MKEFRKNQFRYGWTRTLQCSGKIRAAEEDCTQQEIVSALLKGYLNGVDPDDDLKKETTEVERNEQNETGKINGNCLYYRPVGFNGINPG